MVSMHCFKNREEWLHGRTTRLGGSDAGCVVDANPWKDKVTLWKEKLGYIVMPDISEEPAVKYGSRAEHYLRTLFKMDHPELRVLYKPHNMWTNDKVPWAHASLDGWLVETVHMPDGSVKEKYGIWECKTTTIQTSEQWKKWEGRIPDQYYCQLLHYFAVTEFEFAVLVAQIKFYHKNEKGELELRKTTREYRIERSEVEDDIKYLMGKEVEFLRYVDTKTMPPMMLPTL